MPARECAPALSTNQYGDHESREGLLAFGGDDTRGPIEVATACNAHGGPCGRMDFESETFVCATGACTRALKAEGADASEDGTGRGVPVVAFGWQNSASQGASLSDEITPTLDKSKTPAVAFNLRGREEGARLELSDVASLRAASGGSSRSYVTPASHVRRLTPRECERLQNWPDDYTAWGVDDTGRCIEMADGPRYRMIGNGVGAPVAEWIGRRILDLEATR